MILTCRTSSVPGRDQNMEQLAGRSQTPITTAKLDGRRAACAAMEREAVTQKLMQNKNDYISRRVLSANGSHAQRSDDAGEYYDAGDCEPVRRVTALALMPRSRRSIRGALYFLVSNRNKGVVCGFSFLLRQLVDH